MQTTYQVNHDPALEGTTVGVRKTKPGHLPYLPQISTITLTDSSEAGNLVITVVDDQTQQSYSLTVAISGATEATSLDEMVAAWQADSKFNDLFSVTEDGALVFTATARHANRSYTITTTPPGSMVATPAITQAAGGTGLRFGRFVARGSGGREIQAVGAATALSDLYGMLPRTDADHFHSLESDGPSDVDTLDRGRTHKVLEEGRMWVTVEEDVTPASTPYMRRAQTSGSGEVGGLRASPAGGQQLITATPAAINLTNYGFSFGYLGRHYSARYTGDGTTTVAVACDGLVASLGTIAGLTITDNATDVTVQTAAGTQLDYFIEDVQQNDTPAASVALAETTPADVDAIDVSAVAQFETPASAGGVALLHVRMAP